MSEDRREHLALSRSNSGITIRFIQGTNNLVGSEFWVSWTLAGEMSYPWCLNPLRNRIAFVRRFRFRLSDFSGHAASRW